MGRDLFADCSDDEFECVFNYDYVFAVPKQGRSKPR
jgi:hypothetical protein